MFLKRRLWRRFCHFSVSGMGGLPSSSSSGAILPTTARQGWNLTSQTRYSIEATCEGRKDLCEGILRCSAVAVMFVVGLRDFSNAQSMPPGSYQQTCRNIDFHDDVLSANCQDSTGRWQSAQLRDVQSCRSDIINDDGALRCSRSGGVAAGLPGGSYTQSCQDVQLMATIFKPAAQRQMATGKTPSWTTTTNAAAKL